MKTARLFIFLLVVVGFLLASRGIAAAQSYLGQFCWGLIEAIPPGSLVGQSTLPLKGGVTHVGGAYYLLQGKLDTDPLGKPLFLNATGVVVGDEVWLSGSTTQDYTPDLSHRNSGTMQLRLDLSTLNGTFWRIQTNYSITDGMFIQTYITGGATFQGACP